MTACTYRFAAMAVAGVLLLAACGNDDEPETAPVDLSPPTVEDTPTPEPGTPAPTPAPTPEPAAPETYVVQEGDTLSGIAQRFGTTIDAIVAANDLADPDRIFVGDELVIPSDGAADDGEDDGS